VGCGGETIEPVDGESKKVPRNVAKIYAACKDINEETDAKTLKAKFDEVRMIGHQAIKPGISFFGLGKRDTETQNFYDKFKEAAPRPK
ncbi:MAG TPA: hypothetical protein VJL60_03375, partial [Gammaproteobacteria bacterium]|nr:hypothetical protein [Gammaproteobacteria bacterium]